MAQLFSVPNTMLPVGSALVFNRSSPAAGPPIAIGVCAVIRRPYLDGRTTCHLPPLVDDLDDRDTVGVD